MKEFPDMKARLVWKQVEQIVVALQDQSGGHMGLHKVSNAVREAQQTLLELYRELDAHIDVDCMLERLEKSNEE